MNIKNWTSNATKQQQLIYYDVAHPLNIKMDIATYVRIIDTY